MIVNLADDPTIVSVRCSLCLKPYTYRLFPDSHWITPKPKPYQCQHYAPPEVYVRGEWRTLDVPTTEENVDGPHPGS